MSTIETVQFKLVPGTETAVFEDLDRKVETEYMARRPGFVSREVSRSEDGEYLVIVHWATPEDADATMNGFFGAAETQDFLAAVDKTTVRSARYAKVVR
ncbi:antibiotic biosynthesis monooxygenase family protein [Streptomyces sp. NPDC016309]|uniref:antibiotic biosynthesis monooxygenase family protein n=1 Tax=Streptomyces sp. NPDC016309 TaxID=3364965 RepID=UPI0036FB9CC1